MEKNRTVSRLEFLRDLSKEFDPIKECLLLFEIAKKEGCVLKDYKDENKAQKVCNYLESLLSYCLGEPQNYGVLVVRDTEVNVYSYWNPISEEEEKKILERKKRELWSQRKTKQPMWLKKYRAKQEQKRKQESKYLK